MISHKYRCIFIHQRKTAGTSIIHSFGYTGRDREWHMFNDGTLSEEWQRKDEIAKDYLVFTVARNPWDRFISGWKCLPYYQDLSLDGVIANLPQEGAPYRHLTRPQLDILIDAEGNFVPDIVIRFDTLREDFREVCKQIGKPFHLPRMNTTSHRSLKEYTSQAQIDFVRRHFKKDIDFFSYQFDQIDHDKGKRGVRMRRNRYLGLAKARLQHLATASANNLQRVLHWFNPYSRSQARRYYGTTHNLEALIKTHLFVICPNQSGSTYLQRILATSQNSWNLPREGQHVTGFAGPSSRGLGAGKLWATDHWLEHFIDPTAYDWPLIHKAWYSQAHSRNPNASVFVEKSPPFLVNTAQLVRHFENCKFIFMVRNPYATVEGIRRRRRTNKPEQVSSHEEELKQAAKHVMTCFDYQRQNIEMYTDNSVFFTYEQMCDQPAYVEGLIKSLVPELDDLIIKQHIRVKDYNEMLRNMNEQQISRLDHDELRWINEVFDEHQELLDYFGYARLG